MDENTLIQELKNQAKEYCTERDWHQFHTLKDLALALSIEVAELLEIFRFKKID